jgi:sigma-54 dependent transcriptional regulator, acetoin dehydrogenase operon transcriptional activator AcoR
MPDSGIGSASDSASHPEGITHAPVRGRDKRTLPPPLARSWQRCLEAGLAPNGQSGAPHASAAQLARARQRLDQLLFHARPVMDYTSRQIRDSGAVIILADDRGMLLDVMGDPGFASRAERVALRPGAIWQEQYRGTNAIGTALVDEQAIVVRGPEHFLSRNRFLSCAAAPIRDPLGRLLGAIDISCDRRTYHPHTAGLVHTAARMIERRLFDARHGRATLLRLHGSAAALGSPDEGLLALDEAATVVGANSAALQMLGIGCDGIGAVRLQNLFDLGADEAVWRGWPPGRGGPPRRLPRLDGEIFWGQLDAGAGHTLVSVPAKTPHDRSVPHRAASTPAPSRPRHGLDALDELDTGDAVLGQALDRLRRVAGKPVAVLLLGETGSGKEVLARAAHASGPRRDGPFVAVNCAALPDTLIEAELFGYGPGAFTGARREGAPGRLREAHGGTLFLDEIGDMPLAMQSRLLRVLQDRQVVPLGGGRPVAVDFALVSATHRTLRDEIAAGRFREDLYYRINGLTVTLPPLRQRTDFTPLVERMLAAMPDAAGVSLDPRLADALARHAWPGNLRQLAHALQTAVALLGCDERVIERRHLPEDLQQDMAAGHRTPHGLRDADTSTSDADLPCPPTLRGLQADGARKMVQACGANLSEAARRLGISRNTLYRLLRGGASQTLASQRAA